MYILFEYIEQCNLFLWCKAEHSASFLQFSVSHDPSEIIITCDFVLKLHFLLLSMLKTVVLLNNLVETMIHIWQTFM